VSEWKEIIIKNFVAIDGHCNKVLNLDVDNLLFLSVNARHVVLGTAVLVSL
jgi:hypothetical protein